VPNPPNKRCSPGNKDTDAATISPDQLIVHMNYPESRKPGQRSAAHARARHPRTHRRSARTRVCAASQTAAAATAVSAISRVDSRAFCLASAAVLLLLLRAVAVHRHEQPAHVACCGRRRTSRGQRAPFRSEHCDWGRLSASWKCVLLCSPDWCRAPVITWVLGELLVRKWFSLHLLA